MSHRQCIEERCRGPVGSVRELRFLPGALILAALMEPGEIITFDEMRAAENVAMLQRGMMFRPPPDRGVILMSLRPNAPYADRVASDGSIEYEGHDAPRAERVDPKSLDQPRTTPRGTPTENGKFADWTDRASRGEVAFATFAVYEKLRKGIWTFRGIYALRDYAYESDGTRRVFRFKLVPTDGAGSTRRPVGDGGFQERSRQIPTHIKQQVFKRDHGRCVICGSNENLHFDHDLPYSRGGTSLRAENVRLLCARHNLSKGNRIE
jgi:hypothetical protein